MGERFIALIVALAVLIAAALTSFSVSAQSPTLSPKSDPPLPKVKWRKVPGTEQKVLAPLEKDWDRLGPIQQRKLIGAAKTYPKLAPIQQERFQARLKEWTSLTLEQRNAARDKYKDLESLPPEKQYEIRERWIEKAQPKAEIAGPAKNVPASEK